MLIPVFQSHHRRLDAQCIGYAGYQTAYVMFDGAHLVCSSPAAFRSWVAQYKTIQPLDFEKVSYRDVIRSMDDEGIVWHFDATAAAIFEDCRSKDLPDVFLRGEITRGNATRILQKPERTARRVLGTLLEEGLLASDAPGAAVRLGFPAALVGYYFPRLYPVGLELDAGRHV